MGIQARCSLDGVFVKPPINITELQLSIARDPIMHGMQFEASTMSLIFIDDAFDYIESKFKTTGLKSEIICLIESNCDDLDNWEHVIEGKFNIAQRKKHCGNSCTVSLPIESSSCEVLLNNKINQQVDIDKVVGQDGITSLPNYFNLGIDMVVPTKDLQYQTYGLVKDEGDTEPITFEAATPLPEAFQWVLIRPDLSNEVNSNIKDSQLTGVSTLGFLNTIITLPVSPMILYNEPKVDCFSQTFKINGRLKGRISLPNADDVIFILSLTHRQPTWDGSTFQSNSLRSFNPGSEIHNPVNYEFDWTFTEYEWSPINDGSDSLTLMAIAGYANGDAHGSVVFDKETFFKADTIKACPPTNTKAYLVHETLSRVTEAITNYCVRVKSEYYGRVDSEPFDFPVDGCGGLRFLTSGLKLRNATNATFFASLQNILTGLKAIDNIGSGIEEDPDRPGYLLLRVEGLDFFYRNVEIMRCASIPALDETIDINKAYSTIQVGYEKWETLANFGLDEYNSTREYRTSLTSVNNILKILSNLVAGEYPIEVTREQQYVETSQADTRYDNEVFIMLLKRITAIGYPYGEMIVEQGNVSNPENIFSPSSILNYGISPVRNLLRWFRSIAASYPDLLGDNQLYFNSGTGNILAKGELAEIYGGSCRLENDEIQENQNIAITIFQDQQKATPLWRNEPVQYDYPMSLADYKHIKNNAYGYISYQCGNGDWKKAFISDIIFKPFTGKATFKLFKKW